MIIKITEKFTKTEHTFDVYYLSGYTRLDVPENKLTKTMIDFINHSIMASSPWLYRVNGRI